MAIFYEVQLSADGKGHYIWFDYDEELVAAIKQVPHTARKWDPEQKVWFVDKTWFKEACKFLDHALGKQGYKGPFHQERPQQERTKAGRAYQESEEWFRSSGQKQSAAEKPKKTQRELVFEKLYLLPKPPPEVLAAAFRALCLLHHPDKGGDHRTMCEINLAYEQARKYLEDDKQRG